MNSFDSYMGAINVHKRSEKLPNAVSMASINMKSKQTAKVHSMYVTSRVRRRRRREKYSQLKCFEKLVVLLLCPAFPRLSDGVRFPDFLGPFFRHLLLHRRRGGGGHESPRRRQWQIKEGKQLVALHMLRTERRPHRQIKIRPTASFCHQAAVAIVVVTVVAVIVEHYTNEKDSKHHTDHNNDDDNNKSNNESKAQNMRTLSVWLLPTNGMDCGKMRKKSNESENRGFNRKTLELTTTLDA